MFPILAGSNPSGYNLTRSLRFRASASATLSRTPSVAATSNKTFTVSFWMKPSLLVPLSYIWLLDCAGQDFGFYLNANYTASFQLSAGSYYITTSQVFRDPASWYHMVLSIDTTQATAANRVKLYVNGSQVTAFSSATYPPQNTTFAWNQNAQVQYFGRNSANASILYDGYLAEIYNIDGQALTPSSFGSTNALTGVWQPARYTGSYGTNGFYLPFTDNSAATAAAIGKDSSGNGNNWTPNNISVTAGVTYDSMTDVPTLTSATAANFAVFNPLDKNSNITVSGGNLNAISDATTNWRSGAMTFGNFTTGKWYYEVTANSIGATTYISAGWELTSFNHTSQTGGVGAAAGNNFGVLINNALRQTKVNSTTFSSDVNVNSNGDVLIIAVDFDAGKGWIGKNGTWYDSGNPSAGTNPCTTTVSGGMTPAYQAYNAGSLSFNAGQRAFSYTAPTGFVALNTFNLPDSTIVKGNTVMDATLYTGTGASLSVTNTASFKPDLVWVKSRSGATDHAWYDSVRGVQKQLESNTTTAETTETTGLTAFGSAGFTVGALAQMNTSAATYVGWQWQAGQGSSSSNTNGTITSTVSVNASAGFSVVTYTGTNVSGATIGHGLGVAPRLIIIKNRSSVEAWPVYHSSVGATKYLVLNTTAAEATASTPWNNTAPTSTVFSLGNWNALNESGSNHVAYCWTPIAGFSAFGSYTGNGSTDGSFVYTGFRPKFVLIKASGLNESWYIYDSTRNTYNVVDLELNPNNSGAEATFTTLDFLSNGFKLRTTNSAFNSSGATYIYACFSENPFKNALAR